MKSSTKPKRPSYSQVDAADREAQLSSRTDILSKSFATDLWMKVISRSIDDAVLYRFMKLAGKELKEEEEEFEASAWSFLFNDNHRIPMGDYLVDIDCPKCRFIWSDSMSKVAGTDSICPNCGHKTSWKYTQYIITDNQTVRDVSLQELLSLWGIEDIKGFREGCRNRINEMVEKKLATENKRIENTKPKPKPKPKIKTKEVKDTPSINTLFERMDKLELIVKQLVDVINKK